MKGALLTSETLANNLRIFINIEMLPGSCIGTMPNSILLQEEGAREEGKWLPKTSRKSVSQSVFCGASTYCVLNTVPPLEDDHGNSNSSHVKIFLPKKLLECLPKCSSLPKERHRWNTNERS